MVELTRNIRNIVERNGPFVRWWILACCITAVLSGVFVSGGARFLAENDTTNISWLIITIMLCGSAYYGVRLFRGENLGQGVMEYLGDLCTSLGLLGTIIGLIMMIGGAFTGINIEDQASIKSALVAMSSGIGAALSTTLVGVSASIVLGLQKKFVETNWV